MHLLGSSPLSRGIRGTQCHHPRAGSDHPRSRGEYLVLPPLNISPSGSSPLSRGIRARLRKARLHGGIIPALAGNTVGQHGVAAHDWDHPRSRGEYMFTSCLGRSDAGSSPLSRGIPWRERLGRGRCRIIPALAGNTTTPCTTTNTASDHPRSRGEYLTIGDFEPGRIGSSPLSRGILCCGGIGCSRGRIIPALAGNTWPGSADDGAAWDHPRSRGEYMFTSCLGRSDAGSSPLSRGIRRWGRGGGVVNRIIPALAGNTSTVWRLMTVDGDHPRSRGEYDACTVITEYPQGSSPLSRGILEVDSDRHGRGGIIPALAGNTPRPAWPE